MEQGWSFDLKPSGAMRYTHWLGNPYICMYYRRAAAAAGEMNDGRWSKAGLPAATRDTDVPLVRVL